MRAAPPLACSVAIDAPSGPWMCQLTLPAGATVADALAAARALAARGGPQGVDWDGAPAGVWGERCPREQPLAGGERVELYRPLAQDPRERRRARAGTTRGPLRRPGL